VWILVPLCPTTPLLPLHLLVSGVHDEWVGASTFYHLSTPGLWCRPHWAVQFAVCLVVAMMHVPVLEFMLEVHQSTIFMMYINQHR
jgi:hypothetical protein